MAFTNEIPIIWHAMRALFLLPVTFTPSGGIRFTWRSREVLVAALGWIVMFTYMQAVVVSVVRHRLARMVSREFVVQEAGPFVSLAISAFFCVLVPATLLTSIPAVNRLTLSWERIEELYRALTGTKLRLGIEPVGVLSIIIHGYMFVMAWAFYNNLDMVPWQLPPLIHTLHCLAAMQHAWSAIDITVGVLSCDLAQRLPHDSRRYGAYGVRLHRLIWIQSIKVMQIMSFCWGRVQLFFVFSMYTMWVTFLFTLLHTIFNNDNWSAMRLGGLTVVAIGFWCALFISCFTAQMAVDAVQTTALRQLLGMTLTHQTRAFREEVFGFLQDIRDQKPVLSVGGFTSLSRSLLVTIVSTSTTYLVIMSQLAMLV